MVQGTTVKEKRYIYRVIIHALEGEVVNPATAVRK